MRKIVFNVSIIIVGLSVLSCILMFAYSSFKSYGLRTYGVPTSQLLSPLPVVLLVASILGIALAIYENFFRQKNKLNIASMFMNAGSFAIVLMLTMKF